MKLYHGDCLEVMQDIPDGSVDLILTDPPYGTTACKWDSVIPFEPMWEQVWRVLKPNGACALFGSEPFSSSLRMSQIKRFKYDWYINKNSSPDYLQAKRKPMNYVEVVSIFTGVTISKTDYYPQGLKPSRRKSTTTTRKSSNFVKTGKSKNYELSWTNYPRTLLNADTVNKNNTIRYHETQKPVALLEYLIKTYTLEGETVLDFTMGSGSTGVAAKNLNRKFIGIEQDAKYFQIAQERIGS